MKNKSKILRTYFALSKLQMTLMDKAIVYVLHYIQDRKSPAKNVKQFLKKSCSFRTFGIPLDDVVRQLTNLDVSNTEQRVKRRRVINENSRGARGKQCGWILCQEEVRGKSVHWVG